MENIQRIIEEMLTSSFPILVNFGERLNVECDAVYEELNMLRTAKNALEVALESEQRANVQLRTLIKKLERRIKQLERKVFGKSSEKSDQKRKKPREESLNTASSESTLGNDYAQEKPKRTSRGRGQKPWGAKAKREQVTMEAEKAACDCHDNYIIGEDVIERVKYKKAEVVIVEEHYKKRKCRCCGKFWQAKVPPQLFEGSYVSNSMLAGLIVGKYADFLPIYRQAEIFKRSDVYFERSTLNRWTNSALIEVLRPIWDLMLQDTKRSTYLQMDETTAPTLKPGNGKVKTAYALALLRDQRRCSGNELPCVVFQYAPSRAGDHIEEMLEGFDGRLQVDGYTGYVRLERETRKGGSPLTLIYCWAHVRRKFENQWKSNKCEFSKHMLDLIGKMYAIEVDLKGKSPRIREQVRQREAAPILNEIHRTLVAASQRAMNKDGLGNAIVYTLKLWNGLTLFVDDGRLEIDNNNVENTIRKWVMTRKNSLFAGSEAGGEAWAIAASIIGTCALLKLNPYDYLEWVFNEIAKKLPRSEYGKLLPWEYRSWILKNKHNIE